jgi:hypothetical protein
MLFVWRDIHLVFEARRGIHQGLYWQVVIICRYEWAAHINIADDMYMRRQDCCLEPGSEGTSD